MTQGSLRSAALAASLFPVLLLGFILAPAPDASAHPDPDGSNDPEADYWVYVGAESADRIHRVRFGPDGIEVERSVSIGRLPTEMEGPHGLAVSPDGRYLFMTTGHGVPDGHFWKFEIGPDTLVAEPILLGRFPATLDVTPDGLFAFIVNFNLYGAMVPSTMSVVYTPDVVEVDQFELCTMPHGVRTHPSGYFVYSACMMDDEIVEVDTRSFQVSRRFSVDLDAPGPLPAKRVADAGAHHHHEVQHPTGEGEGAQRRPDHEDMVAEHDHSVTCSPTWVHPSHDGESLFVACNRGDRILEVAFGGWELLRTLDTGRGPYNLEVTSDGRLLITTLKQGDAVEFFDLATGRSLARTPTSTRVVHGVVVSPDDRYAFVSVEGVGAEPGKVDVFDLSTFQRVASAEVGQQASGIAFYRMEPR
jgi:DNA-binding beta-propeller fold protein YncE